LGSSGRRKGVILSEAKDLRSSVPIAQAQELFEKLQAAGVPVAFIKVDDAHTFRTPEARRQLALETLAFFHRNLSPAPK
jgi:dipeptidyl aminopeptidase/acylaminoacyl peptidase